MKLSTLGALAFTASAFLARLTSAQTPLTVTWDPAAVDAQCKAAVTGSGNTYNGQIDVIYTTGLSGAQSGTAGSGISISAGTFTATANFTNYLSYNMTACCM
ncbi:hypothetical protein HDU93_004377 [Gonapodya sp. JEL0774]|nr:hypothetical protein HDU93_004377 [Gonapodya sp. JEL0774]